MLRVRTIVLTFFMNEDHTSLMNFHWFVVPDEPNCLLCCFNGNDGNVCHPSHNYPLLLDGYQCFICLGPHLRSSCHNSIPQSLINCCKCHLLHNKQALGMSLYMKEGMVLITQVKSGWMIPNSSLGNLVLQPIRHAQGHAIIEKHHLWRRVGLMDVATPLLEECEDDTHTPQNGDLRALRDSQSFRARLQRSKHLTLKYSSYHWKATKV